MSLTFIPSGKVDIPELPFKDNINLKATETALIIVDMQNDFVKPEGSLQVDAAGETITNIQSLLRMARQSGTYVAYTQDTAYSDDKEFAIWPEHCLINSWGWEIIDELKPQGEELICRKNRYDGFYGTWLEHFLSYVWNVQNVIIVGTVSNICVLHTAASAALRWFNVVMPADGISALTDFDQALTLHQVSSLYAGQLVKTVKDIRLS
ncbi:MAG: isochorismatase family protein [Caldithrix sp.]|nr:isochorismatase family protein [Caldithrix sp.]